MGRDSAVAHKAVEVSENRKSLPNEGQQVRSNWRMRHVRIRRGRFSGGTWVPDSGQMRVFHAADERIPKTEDSLADDAVCCEPVSAEHFPDHQGKYREFRVFGAISASTWGENHTWPLGFLGNSLKIGTGKFDRGSGNSNSLILSGSGSRSRALSIIRTPGRPSRVPSVYAFLRPCDLLISLSRRRACASRQAALIPQVSQ
jgi:hypothetical protein